MFMRWTSLAIQTNDVAWKLPGSACTTRVAMKREWTNLVWIRQLSFENQNLVLAVTGCVKIASSHDQTTSTETFVGAAQMCPVELLDTDAFLGARVLARGVPHPDARPLRRLGTPAPSLRFFP